MFHQSFLFYKKLVSYHLTAAFAVFPGCPVVKNPPSNTVDAGLIRDLGTKISHTPEQLSPSATTTEPMPQLESLRPQ